MYGLNSGTRIGPYLLDIQLGAGGQGSVWQAFKDDDPRHLSPMAIKVIPVRGSPQTMVERVRRESEALLRLSQGHPSICLCHGVIEDEPLGVLAVVMEKVEGVELADAIRDPRCNEESKLTMLTHVARALSYLHNAGFVHRDIKPPNILVTHQFFASPLDPTTVKLVDFGIAIPILNPSPLTEIGTVIGTPAYMPPERIDPMFWKSIPGVPSEDVFAFGVVAFEALFGRHPSGVADDSRLSEYAERYRAISRSVEPWPIIPAHHRWALVLQRALALKASERLVNGAAVVATIPTAGGTVDDPSIQQGGGGTRFDMPVMGSMLPGEPAPTPMRESGAPVFPDAPVQGAGRTQPGSYQGPAADVFLPTPPAPGVDPRGSYPNDPRGTFVPDQRGAYAQDPRGSYPQDPRGSYPSVNNTPGLAAVQGLGYPPAVAQAPGRPAGGGGRSGLMTAVLVLGVLIGVGLPVTLLTIYSGNSQESSPPPTPPVLPTTVPTDPTASPTSTGTEASTSPTATASPTSTHTSGGTAPTGTHTGTATATTTSPFPFPWPTATTTTTTAPTGTTTSTGTATSTHGPIIIGPSGASGAAGASAAGAAGAGANGAGGASGASHVPPIFHIPHGTSGASASGASGASGAGATGASGASGAGAGGAQGGGTTKRPIIILPKH